ncbi:uncharacterized protein LOC144335900 isoform X2 [Macaca mulatta]
MVAAAAPGPGSLRQEGGWRRKRPSPESCSGAAEHRPPQPTSPVGYWASPRQEEGKAAASRSLRGSWRRRLAHPGPSGRGGRGAGCSGPNPGRCGDSTAPRGRPHPCPARRRRQRNGLVKLRLTECPEGLSDRRLHVQSVYDSRCMKSLILQTQSGSSMEDGLEWEP